MEVMANIAKLANIKYIEDFVEIEKDRGEDLIQNNAKITEIYENF